MMTSTFPICEPASSNREVGYPECVLKFYQFASRFVVCHFSPSQLNCFQNFRGHICKASKINENRTLLQPWDYAQKMRLDERIAKAGKRTL